MSAKPNRHPEDDGKVDAIVDAIVQVFVETGDGASETDLIARGFSRDDIEKHGPAAAAIANGRAIRNVEAVGA